MDDALVIGAGVAGLAVAGELAAHGLSVTILEARDRIGGRILTLRPESAGAPVELGAEFVHGRPEELWKLLEAAQIATEEHAGDDICYEHGALVSCGDDDDVRLLDQLAETVRRDGDMSFEAYLQQHQVPPEIAESARSFVEGFNAADARRIGIASLSRQQEAEEEIDGGRAWHAVDGYDLVPAYLARRAEENGAHIELQSPVSSITWSRGHAEARSNSPEPQIWRARKAIITVPLGVLQARSIQILPEPTGVLSAADTMASGAVQRIVLVFRSRFWVERFPKMRFLFAEGTTPSTFWTQQPTEDPVLVGWIGGPRAVETQASGPSKLLESALRSLEKIFALERAFLEQELLSWHLHDWQNDPYSLGAYSYAPVGALESSEQMTHPAADTLFFAGEHTDTTGHWGTVHGALRSGLRAARQILAAVRKERETK